MDDSQRQEQSEQQQPSPVAGAAGDSSGQPCEANPLQKLAERFRAVLASAGRAEKYVAARYRHCVDLIRLIGVAEPAELSEEAVMLALGQLRLQRGSSARTRNYRLTSFRQFCKWMIRRGVLAKDPTADIRKEPEDADRRHERINFTDGELARMLDAAMCSQTTFDGSTGLDRCALYRAAACTGLRRSTLAALTVDQFDLAGACPGVRVRAYQEKSRRDRFVPLRPDDAAWFAAYLSGKMPKARAFRVPRWNFDRMFKRDLAAAGIVYCHTEPPEGRKGRPRRSNVHDFHSLRHTYITRLALANVPLKVAQTLAGHSTPELTARVYSHVRHEDQSAFLAMLPRTPGPDLPKAG